MTRQREIGEKITRETAYYLLSYAENVGRFAQSSRGHWSVDMSFNVDQSRIRQGFAGENLAVIRHLALTNSSKKYDQIRYRSQAQVGRVG